MASNQGTRKDVPTAPGGIAATDSSCSDVTITWTNSAQATGYQIWRNPANDFATATNVGTAAGTPYVEIPAAGITYNLAFEQGRYISKGRIQLEAAAESVTVVWVNEGELGGNPVSRFFGLLMDKMMGPDFEHGLAGLKTLAEATPAAAATAPASAATDRAAAKAAH